VSVIRRSAIYRLIAGRIAPTHEILARHLLSAKFAGARSEKARLIMDMPVMIGRIAERQVASVAV
jgi:hypothetical protein